MACISKRVARGLVKLKAAGVLNWLRRCREGRDAHGRYRLEQETNAYAVLPFSQWKGYQAPPEPPTAPEAGTWGKPSARARCAHPGRSGTLRRGAAHRHQPAGGRAE
jgi:hypothetical protein